MSTMETESQQLNYRGRNLNLKRQDYLDKHGIINAQNTITEYELPTIQ